MCGEAVLHLDNKEQYIRYKEKYRCNSLNELIETLWYNYGVDVEISKKLEEMIIFSEKYGEN